MVKDAHGARTSTLRALDFGIVSHTGPANARRGRGARIQQAATCGRKRRRETRRPSTGGAAAPSTRRHHVRPHPIVHSHHFQQELLAVCKYCASDDIIVAIIQRDYD